MLGRAPRRSPPTSPQRHTRLQEEFGDNLKPAIGVFLLNELQAIGPPSASLFARPDDRSTYHIRLDCLVQSPATKVVHKRHLHRLRWQELEEPQLVACESGLVAAEDDQLRDVSELVCQPTDVRYLAHLVI